MKKEALLYEKLDDNKVHCCLCAHQCSISDNKFGICGVRQNSRGTLYTLVYGETIASHVDPIEKKPLFHFLPSTNAYSVGTAGCNLRCKYCQNWQISQALPSEIPFVKLSPEKVVKEALDSGCKSIAYTYT